MIIKRLGAIVVNIALIVAVLSQSCQKQSPTISPDKVTNNPQPGNVIDTSLIRGWWRVKDTVNGYLPQYFGPDHFYVRDSGWFLAGYHLQYSWHIIGDSLLFKSENSFSFKFKIKKITKDSLVTSEGSFVRLNLPPMAYNPIKTIAGRPSKENQYKGISNVPMINGGPIAYDLRGNLYICDYLRATAIYKYQVGTSNSTLIAGSTETNRNTDFTEGADGKDAFLDKCISMVMDASGNLYFLLPDIGKIKMLSASSGKLYTVAVITSARAMTIDNDDNLLIAESRGTVRKYFTKTNTSQIIAGTGAKNASGDGGNALQASFVPNAIAVDKNGNIYIGDAINLNVRKIDKTSGIISTIAGTGNKGFVGDGGDGGDARTARVSNPYIMCVSPNGNLYFGDEGRLRKINKAGVISTIAGNGYRQGYYKDMPYANAVALGIVGLAVDADENVYIADANSKAVLVVSGK